MTRCFWSRCVRFGSGSLIFTAGVSVGLAANLAVGAIMSHAQVSGSALTFLTLAALLFVLFGYCLHGLGLFVKGGEDAFVRALAPTVNEHDFATTYSWNKLHDSEKVTKVHRRLLFLTTACAPIAAFAALIVAMACPSEPFHVNAVSQPSIRQNYRRDALTCPSCHTNNKRPSENRCSK